MKSIKKIFLEIFFIELDCCWNIEKVRSFFQIYRSIILYLAYTELACRWASKRLVQCIILISLSWPGQIIIRNRSWIAQIQVLVITRAETVAKVRAHTMNIVHNRWERSQKESLTRAYRFQVEQRTLVNKYLSNLISTSTD